MNCKKGKLEAFFGIFLGIIILAGAILLVFQHAAITGFSVFYNGQVIDRLRVYDECSFEPDVYRTWRIENTNDIEVNYTWELQSSNQTGEGIALPGSTWFNTTAIEGTNLLKLYVQGRLHDIRVSKSEQCEEAPEEPEPCAENWVCTNWSWCIDENQARECTDLNVCNTTIEMPPLIQNCTLPEPCIEDWICGNWTECLNESQSRGCVDLNSCNTTLDIPLLVQECNETFPENNQTTPENQTGNQTTPGNETYQNQTEQPAEPPVAEPVGGGGGGGGGGGSSEPELELVTGAETIEPQATGMPAGITEGGSEAEEEPEEQTGFVALVGRAIEFFEERGIDYRAVLSLIGLVLLAVVIVVLSARYRKHFKTIRPRQRGRENPGELL